MDIYIKGMEMPTGELGAIPVMIYADGCVEHFFSHEKLGIAVPVPPHGRMIDADNIGLTDFEIILCQKGNPFKNALEMLLKKIENAPTIIPADGKDTNVPTKP